MRRSWALAALVLSASIASGEDRVLQISVSDSISAPIRAIANEYEKSKIGVDVQIAVESDTEKLVGGQIAIGPSELVPIGLPRRVFARDPIVVAVKKGASQPTKFAHLASNFSVCWPVATNLIGRHAHAVLEDARISFGKDWLANLHSNRKLTPTTAEDVVELVAGAKVDAGIVNLSSAMAVKERVQVIYLPPDLVNNVEYAAAIRPGAKEKSLARDFVEFLYSPGNQKRLEGAGFISPLRPPPELPVVKPSGLLRLFTSALESHSKATIVAKDSSGKPLTAVGISVIQLLDEEDGKSVTFTSADGTEVEIPLRTLKRDGAVLQRMSAGNYRVVFGKQGPTHWVRWLRKIRLQ
jgi:ABC-type molybdate transport system substrate-binding protein